MSKKGIKDIKCYGCDTILTKPIFRSTVFKNLILCKDCKILFKETEPKFEDDDAKHIFAVFISRTGFDKNSYDDLPDFKYGKLLNKETLKKILKEENDWKLLPETQEYMKKIEHTSYTDWIDYVNKYQHDHVKEHGFEGDMAKAVVNTMRRAHLIFPDDNYFKEVSMYVKYNRAGHCKLKVGDKIPEMELYTHGCKPISMSKLITSSLPVLIIAGSYT